LGERRGDFVAVTSGLDAGLEVVSTGAFKLRQGMRVELNNKLNTQPELNPNPSDS
jgi:membrane fusion protein (multidrug efflux system)